MPGQSALPPSSPKLVFRQIARLFLMHGLSELSPAQAQVLLRPPLSSERLAAVHAQIAALTQAPFGARLYGPKVLAAPVRLSLDEYTAVIMLMMSNMPAASHDRAKSAKWGLLAGVSMMVLSGVGEVASLGGPDGRN
jgi:hypothetical protein